MMGLLWIHGSLDPIGYVTMASCNVVVKSNGIRLQIVYFRCNLGILM